jgi:hypothetical protein
MQKRMPSPGQRKKGAGQVELHRMERHRKDEKEHLKV